MGDILSELLTALLPGVIPKRALEVIVAIVLVLVAVAFLALAGFAVFQAMQVRQLALGLFALFFLGLAWLSLRFAAKGFRGQDSQRSKR